MSTHLVFLRLQKARVALLAGGLQGVAPLLHQKVALLHVSKHSITDTSDTWLTNTSTNQSLSDSFAFCLVHLMSSVHSHSL